ncbi:MAG: RNA polymerase sigma factor RpoH [Gammaproteobacteria bacterium]|nr:RNA polymerase sigma factor RpoH [Gammaproteobacteria bacterium]
MSSIAVPVTLPGGSLDSYIQRVISFPMLSATEERELAERFRRDEDLDAARQLVLAHLRFVVRVAAGYGGYGLAQSDLIQEGNIGLMKAVKRFDPDMGVRLVSFAVHWIRAEIHEFILRNWRIVKVATTKAQRKLFFNLRRAKKRLGWMNSGEVRAVALDLGVSVRDVVEMEQRLNAHDATFDGAPEDDEDCVFAPASYLEDYRYEPQALVAEAQVEAMQQQRLQAGIATLDERSRDIIEARWLTEPKATLQDLAERYGVSAERIRQIEQGAFKRLRNSLADEPALLPAPA